MYSIFTYIGAIYRVNVGKYSIHGAYGYGNLVGGFNHLEKYDFVSWDDDIPNWMESHKSLWFQTTNQYVTYWCLAGNFREWSTG